MQQQGEGTVSAMVVEKQKLDNKVKDMRERAQVGAVLHSYPQLLFCRDAVKM